MDLLAKSAAKINAMEDKEVKKTEADSKLRSAAMGPDEASIIYHYLQKVRPSIASSFLAIHPEIDMDYNITLEEVVQEWKRKVDTAAVQRKIKFKTEDKERIEKNRNIKGSRRFKTDNSNASKIEEIRNRYLISENDIDTADIRSKDVENASGHEKLCTNDGRRNIAEKQRRLKMKLNKTDNNPCERNEGYIKVKDVRTTFKKHFREIKLFTPREDSILLNKMEEMGDDLNIKELAAELGRDCQSVIVRVKKLKSGGSRKVHKVFSLAEDEAILERILPGLHKFKLHELVPHNDKSLEEIAETLGRPNKGCSVSKRWTHLQSWIMQHYSGTLNLDIRLMLVNHLAETYQNRESIDWNAVAAKSEFAGHTASNLRQTFAIVLQNAKKSLNTEFSWEQLLDSCREYIRQARKKNSKNTELRKAQVIEYFENYVKKHEIENFL